MATEGNCYDVERSLKTWLRALAASITFRLTATVIASPLAQLPRFPLAEVLRLDARPSSLGEDLSTS